MSGVTTRVRPTDLRVGYRSQPRDVSPDEGPRFAWAISNPTWGGTQSAYRIRLDDSPDELEGSPEDLDGSPDDVDDSPDDHDDGTVLWDSGCVDSSRSVDVPYDGPALATDETYHWTVTVWNGEGEQSAPAEPASFTTAPTNAWGGAWIGRQPGSGDSNGYRSRWRDPDDDPTEWVQVDLGASRSIGAVELHPAEPFTDTKTPDGRTISANDTEAEYRDATVADGPVAFGFPDRYRIDVADDPSFEDVRTVVDATREDVDDPRREPVVHECQDTAGRYVRVTATSLDAYEPTDDRLREDFDSWAVFALAALAVRSGEGSGDGQEQPGSDDETEPSVAGPTDLARDRPVSASSSVETEAWGGDRLTDGEYVSTMASTSPLFRTEFEVSKPVESARARFVGLGYGELYCNGERVTDDVLNPGWTQYDERVLYSTYDVTDALDVGTNALGIWLGRGWFARSLRQWQSFGSPRTRLVLSIEYDDGSTDRVRTNGDWRTSPSPIVANDVYDGETYDARREQSGWAEPGFDETDWESAAVVDAPGGTLSPQRTDPIRVVDSLEPVAILDHADGPILDFGQNHTGWLSIDVDGAEPGEEIVLRHAEALDEDGGLRTVDLRTAEATDRYVASGADEPVTYEPRFTYHGYRYAQVSGYPGELTVEDVRSRVVHTDLESAGSFDCSNEDMAGVQRNARWGLRTNAHSVPTDCPQRDERMGFTGDGHIAARALHYNFDAVRFQEKWFDDHLDTQSEHGYVPTKCPNGSLPGIEVPSWTVSFLAVPWHCYRFHGDESVLEDNYASLRRYVEFWESEAVEDLLPTAHEGYGDWLALENADGRFGEPTHFFTNAYYHRSVDLLAKMADAIGLAGQADHYANRADAIAAAFNDRYFDADAAAYVDRTQATYALPVFFGITPEAHVEGVVTNLVEKVEGDDRKLKTGFLGTRPLLAVLTEYGHADLAYEVASQPEFPGWVYMLRHGATTVWERWDSDSDEHVGGRMNSLNHSPFTCVSEWFYEHLAGIDVRFEGGRYPVEISPAFVEDLSWAEGSVETPLGTVASRWEEIDGGHELRVEIPWNVEASVVVPIDGEAGTVTVDDELVWNGGPIDESAGVAGVETGTDRFEFDVSPGVHVVRLE